MLCVAIWIYDQYYTYAIVVLVLQLLAVSLRLYQVHTNRKKISEMARYSKEINILTADGVDEEIDCATLAPGDVFEVPSYSGAIIPADAILLSGSVIVNEADLTGESIPTIKTKITKRKIYYDYDSHSQHTLYCGTKIIQTRSDDQDNPLPVHALVIRTGL